MYLWRTVRKRVHIWATPFWIRMEQNRGRQPSSSFSSYCSFYTESHARAFEHRFERRDLPTEAKERERPFGVCTSPQHCLQGVEGWLKGSKGLLSLTTSENPIWHPKKAEVAISSEHLVRALSVCNPCCFRNQRNSSSEEVCIFWQ